MGPGTSQLNEAQYVRPYTNEIYMPVSGSRIDDERAEDIPQPFTHSKKVNASSAKLLKTHFAGIWTINFPSTVTPCPRTGHFYVYDEPNHVAYMGYGLSDEGGEVMNDFWALNTLTYQWKQINLTNPLPPRTGSRAILIGTHILIFGGFASPQYLDDLHTIDITNGMVEMVNTTGSAPCPRTSPVVAVHDGKFFVWGGYNGAFITNLNILDFNTWVWREVAIDIAGRTNVPFVTVGDMLYSYGGSKSGGLFTINLTHEVCEIVQTKGAEPPSSVMGSGMVEVDGLLVFFGGQANSDWTLVYACDIKKNWWFVFHILPDGETVSVADGMISDNGLFMLPRIYGFGVVYEKKRREIIAFMGAPEKSPSPLFIVSAGPALSIIHLRDDMVKALEYNQP